MPVALELDEQGDDMAPHVAVELFGEVAPIGPVVVEYDSRGRIAAPLTLCKHAVPQLGVFAASGSACPQSLLEEPEAIEDFTSESHVRARSNPPDRYADALRRLEERVVEIEGSVSPSPAKGVALKGLLCRRLQFGRQHQARQDHHVLIAELRPNRIQPPGVHLHVIVCEGDDFTGAPEHTPVARDAQTCPWLSDVANSLKTVGDPARDSGRWVVVDHEDLVRRGVQRRQ